MKGLGTLGQNDLSTRSAFLAQHYGLDLKGLGSKEIGTLVELANGGATSVEDMNELVRAAREDRRAEVELALLGRRC